MPVLPDECPDYVYFQVFFYFLQSVVYRLKQKNKARPIDLAFTASFSVRTK